MELQRALLLYHSCLDPCSSAKSMTINEWQLHLYAVQVGFRKKVELTKGTSGICDAIPLEK